MAEQYYDAKLISRQAGQVVFQIRGEQEVWETVRDFEFSSERKMMSVVAKRTEDSTIRCFVKGADEVVKTRLSEVGNSQQ